MNYPEIFKNSWVWAIITVLAFWLCTYLPVWIKDDKIRRRVYLLVLVPVSLVLIFYSYPVGLEVFGRWATR